MSKLNPQAFPRPLEGYDGMTLRDWFAGQALAGLLGDPERDMEDFRWGRLAYRIADGALAAREGK